MSCKNQKFGHNFSYAGSNCLNCGVNQNILFRPEKPKKLNQKDYWDILKKRLDDSRGKQYTRHQQDAIDTAEMFNDLKSKGIYFRIFKAYQMQRNELLKCREWVMKKGKGDRGRLFVSVYKKFIDR